MLPRTARRLAPRISLLGLARRNLRAKGPKTFGAMVKEVARSFVGDFSPTEIMKDFVTDVKFITGPVTNYIEELLPLRIDVGRRITRFSKIHSDAEYGGMSHCSSKVLGEDERELPPETAEITDNSFVRFSGELNFPENKDNKIKRSGFCGAQAVCRKVLDLGEYDGIEVVLRSKEPRSYIFGMKTLSLAMLNDMQYQIKLDIPGGDEWLQYHIPWSYFSLTRGGRLCEIQRVNDNLRMESMTFLVLKEQGPFQLDIASVIVHPTLDQAQVKKMLPYDKGQYGTKGRSYT
jgi:hypothetical protein